MKNSGKLYSKLMQTLQKLYHSTQAYLSAVLVVLLFATISTNLYTYKSVADKQSDNYNPLHHYPSSDFEKVYTQNYPGGGATFDFYYQLKKIAPNATIIADNKLSAQEVKAANVFDDFYNRLVGSAEVDSITFKSFPDYYTDYLAVVDKSAKEDKGKNWYLNSRKTKGSSPLVWVMKHDGNPKTNTFLMFRTGEQKILLIDSAVLPKSIIKGLIDV